MLRAIIFALALLCIGSVRADELQEARRFHKAGDYAEALQRVNKFLVEHPKDAQARFLKAMTLTELKQRAEAIAVYTAITEDFPELPEPYNNLAVLYAAAGDYEKARGLLERAIQNDPKYAIAYENLGDVYAKLALMAYEKSAELEKSATSARLKSNALKGLIGAKP